MSTQKLIKEKIEKCDYYINHWKEQNVNNFNGYHMKLVSDSEAEINVIVQSIINPMELSNSFHLDWEHGYKGDGNERKKSIISDFNILKNILLQQIKDETHERFINFNDSIFISHSSKDIEFIAQFVSFLERIGIARNKIFCSSIEGQGVKNGQRIEEKVRDNLIESKLVIYILTNNFFDSSYCTQELGAGWILRDDRILEKATFILKLDDLQADDIKGFINKDFKYSELNADSLMGLVDDISEQFSIPNKKASEVNNIVKTLISSTEKMVNDLKINVECTKEEKDKKIKEKSIDILSKCTQPEIEIIQKIFNSKEKEIQLNPESAIVRMLLAKKIVFMGNDYYDLLDPEGNFSLNPWVFNIINESDIVRKKLAIE